MRTLAKKIHRQLQTAKKVVIVTHQNPDGDALGSASAVNNYLKKINKEAVIFCTTTVPQYFNFLEHYHNITNEENIFNDQLVDTIIVLDSGDLRYAGIHRLTKDHPGVIINIDHHPTNESYGQLNLVDHTASSTAEIIYLYLSVNKISIDRHLATAILTGIITDTGNFTNSATSIRSITIASHLIRQGANLSLINKKTIKNNSIESLKLWGLVLDRLEYVKEKELAYTYLEKKDYQKYQMNEKEVDGISNFMNNIDGIKIGLFAKETGDGKTKISLRTTDNQTDVSTIAKKMGGGGHKKAAGFTTDLNIEEAIKNILTLTSYNDIIKI